MSTNPVDAQGAPRVLVVEDEALIAMDVQDLLEDSGFEVLGPTDSVKESLEVLSCQVVDVAVLDLNLHRERSDMVADCLEDLGVPFLYLTGHRREVLPFRHRERPLVEKPFQRRRLIEGLRALIARTGGKCNNPKL